MMKMMSKETENLYIDRLVDEVENHPHRDEILALMMEQLSDDMND